MADQYTHYNQNQNTDKKTNRVYINPNFNRSNNFPTIVPSSNMYLNPNFSHITPNSYTHHSMQDHGQTSKAKIHVNPNFIKNANVIKSIVPNNPSQLINMSSSSMNSAVCKGLNQDGKSESQVPSTRVAKSRYCLVRQKENVITNTPVKPVKTTVRVNKYKSISLLVVKNNLATVTPISTINASSLQNEKYQSCKQMVASTKNSRFNFVKPSTSTVLNQSRTKDIGLRRYSFLNKSVVKTTSKIYNKLILKKNNIPCPLFKKYGKCLRKIRGTCEYLHDKKHVSICRKFLKGVCHDTECLLSHDLTVKKMPTCHFYLRGACTKENCPYLHVKLNEKTEICQDFLIGYCEKGDKCLFRHINISGNKIPQKVCKTKQSYSSSSKINSVGKLKSRKKSQIILSQECNAKKKVAGHQAEAHRYFKESVEDKNSDEKCNMIKPSRIKLGILPAFIQL